MKNFGFTLAEVLITLGIIGVVAILTIPAIISNYQDQAAVVQLKKSFSALSQAFAAAKVDYGEIQDWCPAASYPLQRHAASCAGAIMSKYFKIATNCTTGNGQGCIYTSEYKFLNGDIGTLGINTNIAYKMLLTNGSAVIIEPQTDWTVGGIWEFDVLVDINGPKPPNRLGYDLFDFGIFGSNYTSFPFYSSGETILDYPTVITPWPAHTGTGDIVQCNKDNTDWYKMGFGCASWAIYNENLDYKYVNDLNWQTKTHK